MLVFFFLCHETRENISNSILEYMALGKPVAATDVEETKEVVVQGVIGFLFVPRT